MTTRAPAVLKIDDTSNNSCDISIHQNSTNDYITCTILTIPPIPLSLWGKFLSVGAIWRRGNIWSWEWADEFHTQMCKWERVRGIRLHRSKWNFWRYFLWEYFFIGMWPISNPGPPTHDGRQPSSLSYFSYICFSVFIILICVIHGIFLVPECRTVKPTN